MVYTWNLCHNFENKSNFLQSIFIPGLLSLSVWDVFVRQINCQIQIIPTVQQHWLWNGESQTFRFNTSNIKLQLTSYKSYFKTFYGISVVTFGLEFTFKNTLGHANDSIHIIYFVLHIGTSIFFLHFSKPLLFLTTTYSLHQIVNSQLLEKVAELYLTISILIL